MLLFVYQYLISTITFYTQTNLYQFQLLNYMPGMINVNKLLLKALSNTQLGYIQGPIRGLEMIQYLKMKITIKKRLFFPYLENISQVCFSMKYKTSELERGKKVQFTLWQPSIYWISAHDQEIPDSNFKQIIIPQLQCDSN